MTMTATEKPRTTEQRQAALARKVAELVSRGRRVESQSDYSAVLVRGHRTNHILHLLLSIVTLGLWLFVWIAMVVFGGERRESVSVDEWGNVSVQKL